MRLDQYNRLFETLQSAEAQLTQLILQTPTSELRNKLTEINIHVISAESVLAKTPVEGSS